MAEFQTWWVWYQSIRDGVEELRQSGTALLEVTLASCAMASGLWMGWPFFRPYDSETYRTLASGAPAWFWGLVWVGQGVYQGIVSYFMCRADCRTNRACRRQSAAIGGAMWVFVAYVLIYDRAPGWMTAIAPVFAVAQCVTFWLLLKRRRLTDK